MAKRTVGSGAIAELLDATGWTLFQLAVEVGTSERNLQRWKQEGGICTPASKCFPRLAKLLKRHGIEVVPRPRTQSARTDINWREINWHLRDSEIARQVGVVPSTVWNARRIYAPTNLSRSPRKGENK